LYQKDFLNSSYLPEATAVGLLRSLPLRAAFLYQKDFLDSYLSEATAVGFLHSKKSTARG
jgi:hypothetical protein